MKKLAILVMILALVLMAAAMASADGHRRGVIQGDYAMIATGSCLHSTEGFVNQNTPDNPAWIPASDQSWVWGATTMAQATWEFERDGTVTVSGTNYVIDFPPSGSPNPPFYGSAAARQSPIYSLFNYTVTPDGGIEVTIPLPNNGKFVVARGKISSDHKTITLWSANVVQPWFVEGVQYGNVVCNTGRVLIRVKEVDD
jgi:type 1 fimbria pilin